MRRAVLFALLTLALGCSKDQQAGAILDISGSSDEPDAVADGGTDSADTDEPDDPPDAGGTDGDEPDAAETGTGDPEPDAGEEPAPLCTQQSCDDDNPCTDDSCNPTVGCSFEVNSEPCDDWDLCTAGDVCADAACTPGEAVVCEDGEPCTEDSCDPGLGCTASEPLDCDDGNDCTVDACDGLGGCAYEAVLSNACRPQIDVTFPPRGATLMSDDGVVTVTGTVTTGAGTIVELLLNGDEVDLAQDGSFEVPIQAAFGGNTLVFDTADSYDRTRKRVQAFNWSTDYLVDGELADPGMALWLGQAVIDDGDHDHEQPDDIATLFELVLLGFDIAALIPSPAIPDLNPIGSVVYDVYINDLTYPDPAVAVKSMPGGLHLTVTIEDAEGDILAQKKSGFLVPQTITGTITIDSITIDADIFLAVDSATGELTADVQNTEVVIEGTNVDIDGLLLSLLEGVINGFVQDFIADIEQQFEDEIETQIEPMLVDILGALAIESAFSIDPIDATADPIDVTLKTGFSDVAFDTPGGVFLLKAGVLGGEKVVPWDPLGVARRAGCGEGTQPLPIPGEAPLEIVVHDDTLGHLLFALWAGGLLEFEVPDGMLEGINSEDFGITGLIVLISAMLPPALSDCGPDGGLVLHIGDMKATASLNLAGMDMDIVAYAAFSADLIVTADGEAGLGIALTGVEEVELEINVAQDAAIPFEPAIGLLIEENVVPGLLNLLADGALGGIPLPYFDLGGLAGLPPDTVIAIDPQETSREPGATVISGTLK